MSSGYDNQRLKQITDTHEIVDTDSYSQEYLKMAYDKLALSFSKHQLITIPNKDQSNETTQKQQSNKTRQNIKLSKANGN